ncbi:MAG: LysM peptidoglycan-binding domain-containing protein [Chloroflexi bacterium]|nr:LysM peptidoglycan-binding domain-containing protein [Chloroflexota bacterium]
MRVELEQICPLLGTRADRATRFAYPTPEHQCYAHTRVSPLTQDEQQAFCLGAYTTCRFYLAHQSRKQATQAASESLERVSTPTAPWRPSPYLIATGALLAVIVCGALLLASGLPQMAAEAMIPTSTPTITRTPTRTPIPPTLTPTATPVPPTVTPTPTATIPPTPTPIIYVVQSGDTLGAIAAKYGVSTQAIMDANGITDARLIRVGTRLVIPPPPRPAGPAATPTRA